MTGKKKRDNDWDSSRIDKKYKSRIKTAQLPSSTINKKESVSRCHCSKPAEH